MSRSALVLDLIGTAKALHPEYARYAKEPTVETATKAFRNVWLKYLRVSESRCSFCRRMDTSDSCFVAGEGGVLVCHHCIALCNDILARHQDKDGCVRCVRTPTARKALTKRQAQIYAYVVAYIAANNFAPSFAEIAKQFEYGSLATVSEHLTNLERKGWIRRRYNEVRAIELVGAAS